MTTEPTSNWRDKLVHDEDGMMRAVLTTHRIAVLGIKADEGEPEFEGPIFMQGSGFEIVPVAVDSGHANEILGERVYERGPPALRRRHHRQASPIRLARERHSQR